MKKHFQNIMKNEEKWRSMKKNVENEENVRNMKKKEEK